jgi:hypothetical protein
MNSKHDQFGLPSAWFNSPAGSKTHYHALGERTSIVLLHGSGVGSEGKKQLDER